MDEPDLLVRLGHDLDAVDAEIGDLEQTRDVPAEYIVLNDLFTGVVQPPRPVVMLWTDQPQIVSKPLEDR